MTAVVHATPAVARCRGHVLVAAKLLGIQLKGLELREAAALQRRGALKCRTCSRPAIVAAGRIVCTTNPSHGASCEPYDKALREFADLAKLHELRGLARGTAPQRFWKTVRSGLLRTPAQTREDGRKAGTRAQAAATERLARRVRGRG